MDLDELEDDACAAAQSGFRYVPTFTDTLELRGVACTTFRELGLAELPVFCGAV